MNNAVSFSYLLPEAVLAGSAVLLFVFAAAARRARPWQAILFPTLGALGLLAAFGLLLASAFGGAADRLHCATGGCKLFFGLLAVDPFSITVRAIVLVATGVALCLSLGSPSLPRNRRGEYHGLLLLCALGACLLASANHLLMIYVALEAVSLFSYLLVGWDERLSRSREAGLKYVLFGGVASGVMLFGMSLLYGLLGDLSLQGIHAAVASGTDALAGKSAQWTALIALVLVLTGFGYKIAAVPFHMWCPDVYEGAPTPFAAFLSVAPKAAGFAVILRFFYGIFLFPGSMDTFIQAASKVPWLFVLGVISAATMTLGNLAALGQHNLKRLLAYSSIAHAGYLLMGVVAGGQAGFEAVTLYLGVYLAMNMGAFAVVSSIDRVTGSEDLRAYAGLSRRAPWLALLMAVFLFSLTGLPPTAGFVGKLYLFAALLARGGFWYIALAGVGILNSVISLYVYARVLRTMYLERTDDLAPLPARNAATAVASVLAVPVLAFGVFWQPLATLAAWSANLFH